MNLHYTKQSVEKDMPEDSDTCVEVGDGRQHWSRLCGYHWAYECTP